MMIFTLQPVQVYSKNACNIKDNSLKCGKYIQKSKLSKEYLKSEIWVIAAWLLVDQLDRSPLIFKKSFIEITQTK